MRQSGIYVNNRQHKVERVCMSFPTIHCITRLNVVLFQARLHLGFYSIFIKDWLKVFKRDQFLIFRTEDYSSHIGEHIKEAIKFLHLRKCVFFELN